MRPDPERGVRGNGGLVASEVITRRKIPCVLLTFIIVEEKDAGKQFSFCIRGKARG